MQRVGFHISNRITIPCSCTTITTTTSMLLYSSVPYFSSSSLLPTISSILIPVPLASYALQSSSSPRGSRSRYLRLISKSFTTANSCIRDSKLDSEPDPDSDEDHVSCSGDGEFEIEIEKIGKNRRRIRAKIRINATLQTVWDILTGYEKLADVIPGLAVSQLLEKGDKFARLFQIGEQNLAFGLKFNAKGIIDCFEKDLENMPSGQRREIEFQMIEGDFQLFQGKWSIEQCTAGTCEQSNSLLNQEFDTTLSYVVDVEPKLWLPVRLVEGRLCREINMNLSSISKEAQLVYHNTYSRLQVIDNEVKP